MARRPEARMEQIAEGADQEDGPGDEAAAAQPAQAYDAKAAELQGRKAKLNFPRE